MLIVTYTDGTSATLGTVSSSTGGSGTVNNGAYTDVYTDALDFYPINNGSEYSVSIGKAIYLTSIVIPATYNGKPVTRIESRGFSPADGDTTVLKQIIIPASVTEIGICAFENCEALSSVVFLTDDAGNGGLKKIDANAFSNCGSLETITLPASVEEVSEYAFDEGVVIIFSKDN